jgi:hypothetical protein
MLALDVLVPWFALPWTLEAVVPALLYLAATAWILAPVVGARPSRLLTRRGRARDPDGWMRFRPALPLLVGTLAAYVGASVYWSGLGQLAVRVSDDPQACVGAIDQQYFAQLAQVIPLLLVAVGLEARFFRRFLSDPVQRAMTLATVALLCIAELFTIGALTRRNQGCGQLLHPVFEYATFLLTLEACAVALVSLAWALLVRDDMPARPSSDVDSSPI